jgi:hypothetical protein
MPLKYGERSSVNCPQNVLCFLVQNPRAQPFGKRGRLTSLMGGIWKMPLILHAGWFFCCFLLRIACLDETADTVTEKEQYCGGLEQRLTH